VKNTASILRTALEILWRAAVFLLAFGLISAVFLVPFTSRLDEWAVAFPMRVRLYYDTAGAVAILIATGIMTRFVDHRRFVSIGFEHQHVLRDLAAGLALGIFWLALSVTVLWAFGWLSQNASVAMSGSLLLGSAISVFLNVVTQQLLLCGYILQTIRFRADFPVALLVSAALFAGYHAGAFQGAWLPAVNVFSAGVLFCLAYGVSGNLWLPVSVHFAWNFLLGPVLGLTVSGTGDMGLGWRVFSVQGPDLFTGGAFGVEGGLVVTLTTAILIVALALIRSKLKAIAAQR